MRGSRRPTERRRKRASLAVSAQIKSGARGCESDYSTLFVAGSNSLCLALDWVLVSSRGRDMPKKSKTSKSRRKKRKQLFPKIIFVDTNGNRIVPWFEKSNQRKKGTASKTMDGSESKNKTDTQSKVVAADDKRFWRSGHALDRDR